jgi:hypothetical protein
MRTKFAIALAIAAICVATAWASWPAEAWITGGGSDTRGLCAYNGHSVVFGPDGIGHLMWEGQGVGCSRYNPISGWTTDYQVTQSGVAPCIALDADGATIHVMYDNGRLCFVSCTRGTDGGDVWGSVETLNTSVHGNPAMASVPDAPEHLVACLKWEYSSKKGTSYAMAFVERINGVWTAERRLDSAAPSRIIYPAIAAAQNGDVFIAYTNASGQGVFVKTRHNGIWGTTVNATPSYSSNWITGHAIEVNPYTGNPHVVFSCRIVTKISRKVSDTTWAVYHTYRNSQGVWQTPEPVSVPRHVGASLSFSHYATMAFDTGGSSHIAWYELYPTESHGVMYSYCSAEGGTWTDPAWLTSDPSASYSDMYPFVAVDECGNAVHAVWCRVYTAQHVEVWGRGGSLDGDGPEAYPMALSQSSIDLFPNPAKAGRVTVHYSLPRVWQMTVTLLDVSGRAVRTQEFAASDRGSAAVDASGLNAGVYVVKLDAGVTSLTRKLVIE